MTEFTDEHMLQMLGKSKDYCAVILKHGKNWESPDRDKIIWEHARRNFELREKGVLAIVCPIRDESDLSGVGVFTGTVATVKAIMDDDPGVQAGIFEYEVHGCRSFPGDALP